MKKRILFIVLVTMVYANGMFAQTEEPEFENQEVNHEETVPARDNMEDLKSLLREFNSHALAEQQLKQPDYDKMYVPIRGRTKFTRRQNFFQRLEISVLGGSDTPEDSKSLQDFKDDEKNDDTNPVNMGLNVGYSFGAVPGHIEGNRLKLNRFGFAYSLGFLASVDRQDKYGATCDLLAKIGAEAGYGHAMGIGLDFLLGTGNSAVTMCIPVTVDETITNYDTEWCLKYGFQIWVRSNLLHANIKNTDIRLFARYVYSKDPTHDSDLDFNLDGVPSGYFIWSPESWQFGLTFCYNF